jgi:hypothetical protein
MPVWTTATARTLTTARTGITMKPVLVTSKLSATARRLAREVALSYFNEINSNNI